jgi:hypothetical protein
MDRTFTASGCSITSLGFGSFSSMDIEKPGWITSFSSKLLFAAAGSVKGLEIHMHVPAMHAGNLFRR